VNVEVGWHRCLDLVQEGAKLRGAIASLAGADDCTCLDVQGSEQISCAMPLIVVTVALDLAGPHGQNGRGAFIGLDLRLFINTEYQSTVGWVQVECDHVSNLIDEGRITVFVRWRPPFIRMLKPSSDLIDARRSVVKNGGGFWHGDYQRR
jgi:hypothetical protein